MTFPKKLLKHCFKVVNGATPDSQVEAFWDGPIQWATPEDLSKSASVLMQTKRTITPEGYAACSTSMVPSGSIVLSTRAPIGTLALAGTSLCTNQGCKSLVPHTGIDSRYFFYQLSQLSGYLNSLGRGSTFLELSSPALSDVEVFVPSEGTQIAIANYLDTKTAAIDALIAKKEELLGVLERYRTSVIVSAVSKSRTSDSVVFEQKALKHSFTIVNGATPASGVPAFWDGAVQWATPEDLSGSNAELTHTKRTLTEAGYDSCGTSMVPAGSLIMSSRAPIGSLAICTIPVCTNQGCKALVPKRGTSSRYFYYQLQVLTEKLNSVGRGSTFLELSTSDLANFKAWSPDMVEQEAIVEHLDQTTGAIDKLIATAREQIQALRKYRASVISAAVTGKLEVPTP